MTTPPNPPNALPTQFLVQTPSGNGLVYSAQPNISNPPPVWNAPIPNFVQQSAAVNFNLAALVTAGAAFSAQQLGGGALPAGWAVNPSTGALTYDGVTNNGATQAEILVTATLNGFYTVSSPFLVQGIGSAPADTTPPPQVTGLTISAGSPGLVIGWNPVSDPYAVGGGSMGKYNIQRNVDGGAYSGLTQVNAPSAGLQYHGPNLDLGSPASPGSTVVNGSSFSGSGFGTQYYGTGPDQGQISAYQAFSGTFVRITGRLVACVNGTTPFGKVGFDIRAVAPTDLTNGMGCAHIFPHFNPFANGGVSGAGMGIDYRPSQGAATANTTVVANTSANMWFEVDYSYNSGTGIGTLTFWANTDQSKLGGSNTPVGTISQAMPSTVYICAPVAAGSGGAQTTYAIDNFSVNSDAAMSYADTTATGTHNSPGYGYQVQPQDAAGSPNLGTFCPPEIGATGGSGPPAGTDPLTWITNLAGLAVFEHFDIYGSTSNSGGTYGGGMTNVVTFHSSPENVANMSITDYESATDPGTDTTKSPVGFAPQAYQNNAVMTIAQAAKLCDDLQANNFLVILVWSPVNPTGGNTPQQPGTNPYPQILQGPLASPPVTASAAYNSWHSGPFTVNIGGVGTIVCTNGIATLAAFIKARKKKLFFRSLHEVNYEANPPQNWWQYASAAQSAETFKQMVLEMDAQGVTNAYYVWTMNWSGNNSSWSNFFPAADSRRPQGYVDAVGFDYYYGSTAAGDFYDKDLNGTFQNALVAYGKPVVMPETGVENPSTPAAFSDTNAVYGAAYHTKCPWVKWVNFYPLTYTLEKQKGANPTLTGSGMVNHTSASVPTFL